MSICDRLWFGFPVTLEKVRCSSFLLDVFSHDPFFLCFSCVFFTLIVKIHVWKFLLVQKQKSLFLDEWDRIKLLEWVVEFFREDFVTIWFREWRGAVVLWLFFGWWQEETCRCCSCFLDSRIAVKVSCWILFLIEFLLIIRFKSLRACRFQKIEITTHLKSYRIRGLHERWWAEYPLIKK